MPAPRTRFQTPATPNNDRADHIWFQFGSVWKCLLCGGVAYSTPPDCPTASGWMPDTYDLPLTPAERALAPYVPKH